MKLKKSVKRFLFFIAIVIIVGVGIITYSAVMKKDNVAEVKVLKEIKEYGYKLKDNKSEAYKKLFAKLEEELKKDSVDEEKYAKLISEMFILDFYSLDEKVAKTDVGGTDFIYQESLNDFLENAENTLYKYVESNIYKQRKQDLPIVEKVTVESVKNETFAYGEKNDDDAFIVEVSWTYKDKNKAKGYQDSATLTFIHNGKRLDLVELK